MLGRGLTLKGLAITYIIRTAKGVSTVDTVQQRARWFGYKMKYLDLCRIFAVGKIIREFQEIRDHEEDLWETVRAAKCQGTNFKNMARIFALSDDLKMTRSSVARTENYTFKFWNKQREFQDIQEYVESNKAILAAVRIEHERQIVIRQFGEGAPFAIIPGVEFDYVKSRFLINSALLLTKSSIDQLLINLLFCLSARDCSQRWILSGCETEPFQSMLSTVGIFPIIVLAVALKVLANQRYILEMIISLYRQILCNFKFTRFRIL